MKRSNLDLAGEVVICVLILALIAFGILAPNGPLT